MIVKCILGFRFVIFQDLFEAVLSLDFFLSISVLEGSTEEKEEYELALEETLFSMVDALNKDTKNEKIVPRHEEHLYFCLDVYDVYRESFW